MSEKDLKSRLPASKQIPERLESETKSAANYLSTEELWARENGAYPSAYPHQSQRRSVLCLCYIP
jgi:hypothetical protein